MCSLWHYSGKLPPDIDLYVAKIHLLFRCGRKTLPDKTKGEDYFNLDDIKNFIKEVKPDAAVFLEKDKEEGEGRRLYHAFRFLFSPMIFDKVMVYIKEHEATHCKNRTLQNSPYNNELNDFERVVKEFERIIYHSKDLNYSMKLAL